MLTESPKFFCQFESFTFYAIICFDNYQCTRSCIVSLNNEQIMIHHSLIQFVVVPLLYKLEQLMRMGFRDDPSLLGAITDPAWNKSPSRRLIQIVYAHFAKINGAGEGPTDSLFSRSDLLPAMQLVVENMSAYNADP
jgi:hypothetical protein